MTASSAFTSLLWFVAILALIPTALWLLKRTPAGAAASAPGAMRTVATLALAPGQRIVAVEIGRGEARRWLVLGVTAQQITTLHEMAPQDDGVAAAASPAAPFAQLLAKFQRKDGDDAR